MYGRRSIRGTEKYGIEEENNLFIISAGSSYGSMVKSVFCRSRLLLSKKQLNTTVAIT